MTDDLTFITNQENQSLQDRFAKLIQHTRYFDCLVGYFYSSGFYAICDSLEKTEKIRVLVGISTNQKTFDLIQQANLDEYITHKDVTENFCTNVIGEMDGSKDSIEVEKGVQKFISWIKSRKMEIRAYPEQNIHAKLYIMTFNDDAIDKGRIITGSSNFTISGLKENIEFNVELKDRSDYEYALKKFNELWDNSVDVSQKYVDTIKRKTWLNDEISPYELYLKFLYEYLKEKINIDKTELFKTYYPDNFMDLQYQEDAVKDAKIKLDEYGGVFISDVVGLGKTYITAMLAQQLDGGTLVIAPPFLISKENPGSWRNIFFEFGVRQAEFESIGMLDKIVERGTEKFKNVIIDEAHRFRTESTQMYEKLFEICRGKRVILVTATPLNNTPMDILSQIKLFQSAHKSTLPNPKVRDLERYFKKLQNRLKNLDRQKDKEEYLKIVKENAEEIRNNVLRHLMVRRTRNSIITYYGLDLKKQGLRFPEIANPEPVIYQFTDKTDKIFNKTLELIIKEFKYSRYMPLLYLKKGVTQPEELSQINMGKFMKILLLKRLESSFYAFSQSVDRFLYSYRRFIEEYSKGRVFVSKKHINKIFELIDDDDEESVKQLVENEQAFQYKSDEFIPKFIKDLKNDYLLLNKIKKMWDEVKDDPKLNVFLEQLSKEKVLNDSKLLIFTESKETANYLMDKLGKKYGKSVMVFSSDSTELDRQIVIENYDATYNKHKQKDDVRILISTDILSEGVNLHRSNVVINYDIPWNPVRMMQRVGRVNRVSKNSPFDMIYTYNFFPAGPINEEISLKEAAEAKIQAFIEMLGNDARLLTDEEIKSHDLFVRLSSKITITGEDKEDDSELKYLTFLRQIRDTDPNLFEKIKRLPRKARAAKAREVKTRSLLTFFRKGKLRKVFLTDGSEVQELDLEKAAQILDTPLAIQSETIPPDYYSLLEVNKREFDDVFTVEDDQPKLTGGRSQESKLFKIIKAVINSKEFIDDDEEYLQKVLNLVRDGAIAKATIKRVVEEVEKETTALKILAKIKSQIPSSLFQVNSFTSGADISGPKEVILSEYLINNG
jgi:superfamily II DNA or RNA helicase/HKD family nuclease